MTLILIAGLAGSGKSTRVRELATRLQSGSDPFFTLQDWPGWKLQKDREELYERLRAGNLGIVESAGFCIPPHLIEFRKELDNRFPALHVEIECFDNNPLQCIVLSLNDKGKQYGENGALARISQIIRDCRRYEPDSWAAKILPVYPCERLVSYRPRRIPEYDNLLTRLRSILSEDGRPLNALDFKAMALERQDEMRATVRELILQSKLDPCNADT